MQECHPLDKLPEASYNLASNTSSDGASPAPLGNLFQCFTAFWVKNFFLMSDQDLPSFSLNPSPLVLSMSAQANMKAEESCHSSSNIRISYHTVAKVSELWHSLQKCPSIPFRAAGKYYTEIWRWSNAEYAWPSQELISGLPDWVL